MDKICCLVAYFLTLEGKAFSYIVNSLYPGTLLTGCLLFKLVKCPYSNFFFSAGLSDFTENSFACAPQVMVLFF